MRLAAESVPQALSSARRRCLVVGLTSVILLSPGVGQNMAEAAAGMRTYEVKGVDTCAAPTTAQMQTWWNNSPYFTWYIYVGGNQRSCAQPNLTAAWISAIAAQGWGLVPIWLGPQAPCDTYLHKISYDPTTAFNQGKTEATAAYNTAINLGMGATQPIVYDIEPFAEGNAACLSAVQAFVRGWVTELHVVTGEKAGVYAVTCNSGLNSFASISPSPDFVWGAWWDGNKLVSDMPCVGPGNWAAHQRHKQYLGNQNQSYGGVGMNVDVDCAWGPAWGNLDRLNGDCH